MACRLPSFYAYFSWETCPYLKKACGPHIRVGFRLTLGFPYNWSCDFERSFWLRTKSLSQFHGWKDLQAASNHYDWGTVSLIDFLGFWSFSVFWTKWNEAKVVQVWYSVRRNIWAYLIEKNLGAERVWYTWCRASAFWPFKVFWTVQILKRERNKRNRRQKSEGLEEIWMAEMYTRHHMYHTRSAANFFSI